MSPTVPTPVKPQIRPIEPTDLPAFKAFLSGLSPGTRYFRFGCLSTPVLTQDQWTELCKPNPERCAQFVATRVTGPGRDAIIGVARLVFKGGDQAWADSAEFSLVVADHMQKRGLGRQLMQTLVGEASRRGLSLIYGDVLPSNTTMLSFCEGLGFVPQPSPEDERICRMVLSIKAQKPEDAMTARSDTSPPKARLHA